MGPFDSPPIPNLVIVPLVMRDKANAKHKRVIVDLNFPVVGVSQ